MRRFVRENVKEIMRIANRELPIGRIASRLKELDKKVDRLIASLHQVQVDNLVDRLLSEPRYQDDKRLQKYGFKATSQFDEDGILTEIYNRIGTTNKRFVEFGVGDGLENNSLYLLHQGWEGLWIEYKDEFVDFMREKFKAAISKDQLVLAKRFITKDNIDEIITSAGFEGEIDFLSIDVDGNDYHLWDAITSISPRVVCIEYNVKFRPPVNWVMAYNESHLFDKSDYSGASLKAMEILGRKKGYSLVGCTLTGANAFFVKTDLVEGKFCEPYSAENHYEPCRYPIAWKYRSGMRTSYGDHFEAE